MSRRSVAAAVSAVGPLIADEVGTQTRCAADSSAVSETPDGVYTGKVVLTLSMIGSGYGAYREGVAKGSGLSGVVAIANGTFETQPVEGCPASAAAVIAGDPDFAGHVSARWEERGGLFQGGRGGRSG